MAQRTLWEEGRQPGPVVVGGSASVLLVAVLLTEVAGAPLGWFFDLAFVLTCLAAALLVRPRDFFTVGVFPPLALTAIVMLLAVVDRGAVADSGDHFAQATVSGLAHRAQGLAIAYALVLGVLALRQVAQRNNGRLRVARDAGSGAATADGPDGPEASTSTQGPSVATPRSGATARIRAFAESGPRRSAH